MLSECLWISSISDSDHGSPSKWSNLDAILAFPARNLAILPLTQRGDLLTCGIEKITDPCLGGVRLADVLPLLRVPLVPVSNQRAF